MAERIGFISFTAFDLRKASEFEGIKTRLYHADRPARSFFDIHPSLPPWRQLSLQGLEPMVRKTPAEMQPLMNEYHRYFMENSIQHEHYARWWRRHHAWRREAEIFFNRFDDLRDHLNEMYNRESYIQQGRLNIILQKAAAKGWDNQEINLEVHRQSHDKTEQVNRKLTAHQMEHAMIQNNVAYHQPDNRKLSIKAHDRAELTGEHYTRQELHPPHSTPPKWAKLLAVADYAQQVQMNLPQATLATHPEGNKPQSIPAASVITGTKI